MGKVVTKKFSQRPDKKRDDGSKAAASASAASAASRAFGPLFNKDLGQHILKNPLVAQGIVDKVKNEITIFQDFFFFFTGLSGSNSIKQCFVYSDLN
jgi:hypothetical protein